MGSTVRRPVLRSGAAVYRVPGPHQHGVSLSHGQLLNERGDPACVRPSLRFLANIANQRLGDGCGSVEPGDLKTALPSADDLPSADANEDRQPVPCWPATTSPRRQRPALTRARLAGHRRHDRRQRLTGNSGLPVLPARQLPEEGHHELPLLGVELRPCRDQFLFASS